MLVAPGTTPGINYLLKVPMDSGATSNLYHPAAMRMAMPFKIRVLIGAQVYLPIEMIGDLAKIGQPGEETLLNLTLGEDTDGDGLPDAWERALLGQGKTLSDINPGDDTDGDGMSNLDEYISGNYAFDKNDGLRLDIVQKQEADVVWNSWYKGANLYDQGVINLKEWSNLSFKIKGEEGNFKNIRVDKVRRFRIKVPAEAEGETHPNFSS